MTQRDHRWITVALGGWIGEGPTLFHWRKKDQGFEWREYVRTTVLLRRKERRQRVHDVGAQAAGALKDAGKSGLKAGASGSSALVRGLGAAGLGLVAAAQRFWRWLVETGVPGLGRFGAARLAALRRGGEGIAPLLRPVLEPLRHERVVLALKVVAPLAMAAALWRATSFGLDTEVVVVGTVGLGAFALLALLGLTADDDAASRTGERLWLAGSLGAIGLSLAALMVPSDFYSGNASKGAAPQQARVAETEAPREAADASIVEGRGVALAGDRLRVSGKVLVLDGIEAPDAEQTCTKESGKTWRCGEEAREELGDILRKRRVRCEVTETLQSGLVKGRCLQDGKDVAAALVAKGSVFAEAGFFASYSSIESAAREARLGLWDGTQMRPSAWRDAVWAEAQAKAPGGCPIKARASSGAKTYVVPWSRDYDGVRIDQARGDRWFCSEDEAKSAGWKPRSRS